MMGAFEGYVFGNNSIYKRRTCLKFEMEDHTSTATVIGCQYYCSKVECMTSCTCHRSCNTFHFRSNDCTCELLRTSEMCMSHNFTSGTILVRLNRCKGIPPWNAITPTQRKLQWMEPHDVGSWRYVFATSAFKRQVARVLHEGTYVPGFAFVSSGKFLAVLMNGKQVTCFEAFQVLTYIRPDDYSWINFTAGDEVPASAVVGGYWRDGTPLYVINVHNDVIWKPGFYNAATEMIYVRSKQILALNLLVENYWMKISIRNQNPMHLVPVF